MTRPRPTVLAFAVAADAFLLGAIWTVATPLFASPDEPLRHPGSRDLGR